MQNRMHREEGSFERGWRGRRPLTLAVASVVAFMVWLVFILFYALYWSTHFTPFQNVIVTAVSLFLTAGVIGIVWMVWGMRLAELKYSGHPQT